MEVSFVQYSVIFICLFVISQDNTFLHAPINTIAFLNMLSLPCKPDRTSRLLYDSRNEMGNSRRFEEVEVYTAESGLINLSPR